MNNIRGREELGSQLLCGDPGSVRFLLLLLRSRGLGVIMKQQIWTEAITELQLPALILAQISRGDNRHSVFSVNGPYWEFLSSIQKKWNRKIFLQYIVHIKIFRLGDPNHGMTVR